MTTPPSIPRSVLARARARRRAGGFTLIELAVALVGGLLVGIAVVGLSKEATNSFHEDMRASQAQFSVRTAIDRLRADLGRAAFMTSPNILGDPRIVSNYNLGGAPFIVQRMAGIRLFVGGSAKKANIALGFPAGTTAGTDDSKPYSNNNNLSPDAIDITGNMNTVDGYSIQQLGAISGCGGPKLLLALDNPPSWRVLKTGGASGPNDMMVRNFVPVATKRFVVRIQDLQGRVQYIDACAAGVTAGVPFVDLGSTPTLVTPNASTNNGGQSAFLAGSTVSPALTVRYKLAPPDVAYAPLATVADPARFDLYRYYLDSAGTEVGTPDLVAEYAVDLKFAFTVDSTAGSGTAVPNPVRVQSTYPFDDISGNNALYGGSPSAGATGPQRIRSVRVRLATRTAIADRLSVVSPPSYAPPDYKYMYRYCTSPSAAPCLAFARVRETITEVALNNLAGAAYP